MNNKPSLVTTHCADSDIERTYPAVQIAMNASKKTTIREMVEIEGLNHIQHRITGFNLTTGLVNSVRFCNEVLDLPVQDEMLKAFIASS